ncbi:MAG: transcription termination factor Rho, partial [Planctomycetota bacterium]|nr:transcription termination factor Rho [Planctomycetota bacterium]
MTEDVEGYLSLTREGFGFLRTVKNSLATSKDDVFVPNHMVKRFELRPGVKIVGKATRKNNRRPLTQVDSIHGVAPADYVRIPEFKKLISEDPRRRIFLETEDRDMSLRVIDLMTPIGFGQRALIVSPPRTGKTIILHKLTKAIVENHPEVEVIVLLVDERPEEVTDFTRTCP